MARNAKNTRMCAGCMTRRGKSELVRICHRKNGEIYIADSFVSEGRSVYLCPDMGCFSMAIKKKALPRSFRCDISDDLYKTIQSYIQSSV